MTGRKSFLTLLILFLPALVFSQQAQQVIDLAKADSVAMIVKYEGDINLLTKKLTNPFSDETLKARAIFRWMTNNIAYDYKYFNKYNYKGREPKTFTCRDDGQDCDIRQAVWEMRYVNKVLDTKKAVCQGYAMLFKKMCGIAGIEAEYVSGYVRTEYYEVGTPGELDHAWNAVKLNGVYYLLDATWASGGCNKNEDGKLSRFFKQYDEYYWLTPAGEFARNHFPEEPKWTLLPNYTKEKFSANPYYTPEDLRGIRLLAPSSGIINAKRGDTIRFKLAYAGHFRDLQINSNIFQNPDIYYFEVIKHKNVRTLDTFAVKKQQYIKYKRDGETYQFAYVVKDYSLDYLDILFDTRRVMRFKVKVH